MLRRATVEDAKLLSETARPSDKRELEELANRPALSVLLFGLLSSEPYAVSFMAPDGSLAGITGVVPSGNNSGAIWMAGTVAIERFPMTFLRRSREFVHGLPHDTLFNIVDARNEVHLKWLTWLGFSFIRKIEHYGPNRVPVYEFARIRPPIV